MAIPEIIHYCWFGGSDEPIGFQKNLKSWKKYAPEYRIQRWDESNFDVEQYAYTRIQYQRGRLDLVSDFVRLLKIESHGGFYLDVDVELVAPLTSLITNQCFWGLEDFDSIASGLIFGAEPQHVDVQALLAIYQKNTWNTNFLHQNCVTITTNYFRSLGFKYFDRLQIVSASRIYPTRYFCPIKYGNQHGKLSAATISIHHYAELSRRTRRHIRIGRLIRRIIGRNLFYRCIKIK
ncbi:glycosyltransferase [Lactiplantibacillus sp. DA1]|uniref:glycosyltransferase family 32 protein n=1 Tax=Lactiplantibacillus sp. DA1 TaxID=3079857 RepID=UPI00292A61A7|nr:glycosyltransferase [Lactiplantibacillus sp. DA1]MDV0430139.1 glycosyltransferase [Lactiplantibacillus sp. DA1]